MHLLTLPAPTMPTDAADFKDMCAVRDQQARCCAMANVSVLVEPRACKC
jgi:hypothetical protein